MTAIVDCMKQTYYKWLSPEERKIISHQIQCQFHFPNCVRCMDRTLNPLAFEPQCHDASNYSGREYGYSLSTLVVNDDKQRIMYYLAGWLGSTHNNCIFKNSLLFQDYNAYFSECEYLLGDSTFECFHFVMGVGSGTRNQS